MEIRRVKEKQDLPCRSGATGALKDRCRLGFGRGVSGTGSPGGIKSGVEKLEGGALGVEDGLRRGGKGVIAL